MLLHRETKQRTSGGVDVGAVYRMFLIENRSRTEGLLSWYVKLTKEKKKKSIDQIVARGDGNKDKKCF